MNAHDFGRLFKAAFGMSDERYARFVAACPGGGTAILIERLRSKSKDEWMQEFRAHAVDRAQEACHEFKDGDLLYRNGKYIWNLYSIEFFDAMKALGMLRSRMRRPLTEEACVSLMAEVEKIRDRRLGPPEVREMLDPDTMSHGVTLGGLIDQAGVA